MFVPISLMDDSAMNKSDLNPGIFYYAPLPREEGELAR